MSKSEDLSVTMCRYLSATYRSFNIIRKPFRLGAFFPFTSVKVELSEQNEQTYYFIWQVYLWHQTKPEPFKKNAYNWHMFLWSKSEGYSWTIVLQCNPQIGELSFLPPACKSCIMVNQWSFAKTDICLLVKFYATVASETTEVVYHLCLFLRIIIIIFSIVL